MALIQDLRTQVETLQQQMISPTDGGEAEEVKKCCVRVEVLEEDVKSLRNAFQSFPDPEQMNRMTRDVLQSVQLSDGGNLQQKSSSHLQTADAAEALRTVSLQQEKVGELEARVDALEEDQSQLAELREFIADQGNQEQLMEELNQQRALIESLMSEHDKLDSLEEMLLKPDASEETSDRADADSKELKLQVLHLRRGVHQLEEDLKHLTQRQDLCEETTAKQNFQGQLDELHGMLEDFILSLTSHLSSSVDDEVEQDQNQSPDPKQSPQSTRRSAFAVKTVNVCRKLTLLIQRCQHLEDSVKLLLGEGGAPPRGRDPDGEDGQLSDVQRSILHLQADCEKLQEATTLLRDDSRRKHQRIEELYKMTEELSVRKADKQMVEDEIGADKTALENKVSRLQFDTTMEQLNAMFHDLLNKVTDQEQDWHSVMDKLSSEMECKLNRIELDSMKKQLEDRWRNIYKTLQAQDAPEADDAAALRKQLVERFHCLSCDRPVLKRIPTSVTVTLPSFPPFPSRRSRRVYPAEVSRQQYRSERIPELVEYGRMLMSRNCGGSHTSTSTLQRRSGRQHTKLSSLAEADGAGQVDIIGEDGRLYRGRLDLPETRSPDSKLPTIKDSAHRTKDRAKSSASLRPTPSPEGGQTSPVHQPAPSARSPQCSRSGESGTGVFTCFCLGRSGWSHGTPLPPCSLQLLWPGLARLGAGMLHVSELHQSGLRRRQQPGSSGQRSAQPVGGGAELYRSSCGGRRDRMSWRGAGNAFTIWWCPGMLASWKKELNAVCKRGGDKFRRRRSSPALSRQRCSINSLTKSKYI
ncbi:Glutamine-rich protein 2 [Oryzias melastigma]|uniref:Glutamine-rich protein 2 n=1 Tax=Oryzias melastigma TaxID=30732 RepID=A0A834EX12_ORYME|nr:Glutamine-rich protein 2 [Oryzias melastigma]